MLPNWGYGVVQKMAADSSSIPNEIVPRIEKSKNNIIGIKQGVEDELPFFVVSEMESIIDVVEDCLRLMRESLRFAEKVEDLDLYKSKNDFTNVMLLLTKYGSEKALLNKALLSVRTLEKRLNDLEKYLGRTKADLIDSEDTACSQCKGNGKLLKPYYLRERGTTPQKILRSVLCTTCGGTGRISLNIEAKEVLSKFSGICLNILTELKSCHDKLKKIIAKYEPGQFKGKTQDYFLLK
jgi:hypothetical protein